MFPFPQTSTFLFLDHSIPMKPRTNVWDHFIAYDAEGNVLIERDKLKAKKVVCKHCEYERLPNATHMKKHFEENHTNEPEPNECPNESAIELPGEDSESVRATSIAAEVPPPKKQCTLQAFVEREKKFTAQEQYNAEMAQVPFAFKYSF